MKYVEFYLEEKDILFNVPEFDISVFENMDEFEIEEADNICESIYSALDSGIMMDLDVVPVFTFKGTDAVIMMERDDFNEKLKSCQLFYTKTEEYEKCAIIENLKKNHLVNLEKQKIDDNSTYFRKA